MFIPLFVAALHLSSSMPVSSPLINHNTPVLVGRDPSEFTDVARYRTLQAIIWSCIATMFACTWVAVHPNLPGPSDSIWTRLRRRVLTMVYALLAPELIALWALRQRIAAREIAERFNDMEKEKKLDTSHTTEVETWTLTHGFFVQMGGFMLCRDKIPIRALDFDDLSRLIRNGKVDPPDISEAEIEDKSKGDFLTKLFVVIQTTWFVIQCLVRWASHLPVTELEVVTLAFAVLNVITYTLWWNKPQNALIPARVELKQSAEESLAAPLPEKEAFIVRKLKEEIHDGWYGWVVGVPYRLGQALVRPLDKMAEARSVRSRSLRFPMFYADGVSTKSVVLFVGITVLFGGLHLIPWSSSSFPTNLERWIWRSSALLTSIHPLLFIPVFLDISPHSINILIAGSTLLYVIGRVALLTLLFVTLRHLPIGAYYSIKWTSFLPHI